jgi:hypothetical protein
LLLRVVQLQLLDSTEYSIALFQAEPDTVRESRDVEQGFEVDLLVKVD